MTVRKLLKYLCTYSVDHVNSQLAVCLPGTYDVLFMPSASGVVFIHVSIQVTAISASPFRAVFYEDEGAAKAAGMEVQAPREIAIEVGSEKPPPPADD